MSGHRLQRRITRIGLILLLLSSAAWNAAAASETGARRLVILGFSGADPDRVRFLMSRDELPALAALAARGAFLPLETTTPASAEAAWASFATGLDPTKHGITGPLRRIPGTYDTGNAWFDVAQREQPLPFGSIALTACLVFIFLAALGLLLFKIILNVNLRRALFISLAIGLAGAAVLSALFVRYAPRELPVIRPALKQPAFWDLLNGDGTPVSAVYAPASFPCGDASPGRVITGPGTPDLTLKGAHWSLFTDQPEAYPVPALGRIVEVSFEGEYADTFLPGLTAPGAGEIRVPLNLRFFKERRLVQIDIRGRRDTLRPGEWSDDFIVRYKQNPFVDLFGMVRFNFVSSGDPFSLYMSPVHVFSRKPPPYFHHTSPFLLNMENRLKNYNYESCDLHFDCEPAALGILPLESYLESVERAVKRKKGNLLSLMGNDDWRCFVSAFSFIDRVSHLDDSGDDNLENMSPELIKMYRLMDDIVSGAMSLCDDGRTEVVVFSPFSLAALPEGIIEPGEVRDDFRFRPPPHYYRGHTSVAPEFVPGFLVTSRTLDRTEVSLLDLAPTALDFFHCPIPEGMGGESLW
jgi:hypothetical protein